MVSSLLSRLRGASFVIALAAAIVGGLLGGVAVTAPPASAATAKTANLADFNPGYIISDELFYNSNTMSEVQIQQFLDEKVTNCSPGYTCLKDKRDNSRTTAADAMCAAYAGAANESAARIIYKVAQACGINPQVLLVMLQKEQGLVTHRSPSASRYTIAMGQGCPDTAACDTRYYGFFNQVFGAARQMKIYTVYPTSFTYQAGKYNNILWHPNTSCGAGSVFIQNQATANLYIYTPYQPNPAALRAGYGLGDGCSSYGNRNFFNYFSDWFGSPVNPVDVALGTRYVQLGGSSSFLGAATGHGACGLKDNGCWRNYQGGAIYASSSNPPKYVLSGGLRNRWEALGYEQNRPGALGYPRNDTVTGLRSGGSWQDFEFGAIYSWSRGTYVIRNGGGRALWSAQNYEHGPLGYPIGDTVTDLRDGGSYQSFEGGAVYASSKGAFALPKGAIYDMWAALGYEQPRAGALGYPASPHAGGLRAGGSWQGFESGAIYSWSGGTFVVRNGAIRDLWVAQNYEHGPLGYPTGNAVALQDGGQSQTFEGGIVYATAAGAYAVTDPAIRAAYAANGSETGDLGYPTGSSFLENGATWQFFEGGALVKLSTGSVVTLSPEVARLTSTSAMRNILGVPLGTQSPTSDAGYEIQAFSAADVYVTGSTTYVLSEPMRSAWGGDDTEPGVLGYPAGSRAEALRGAVWQRFQNGGMYIIGGTSRAVLSPVFEAWKAQGFEHGPLGFPRQDQVGGLRDGGFYQAFEGGVIYGSSLTPAIVIPNGAIRDRWSRLGFEHPVSSSLGYPTAAAAGAGRSGTWQKFEAGAIYEWSGRTTVVREPIFTRWAEQDYEWGPLGYPQSDTVTGLRDNGSYQRFDGGVIYSSSTSGTHAIANGPILNTWIAQNYEHGSLGYPTGEFTVTATGGSQAFQGGLLVWNATTGAVTRQ